jgi:hypothetical protein
MPLEYQLRIHSNYFSNYRFYQIYRTGLNPSFGNNEIALMLDSLRSIPLLIIILSLIIGDEFEASE